MNCYELDRQSLRDQVYELTMYNTVKAVAEMLEVTVEVVEDIASELENE